MWGFIKSLCGYKDGFCFGGGGTEVCDLSFFSPMQSMPTSSTESFLGPGIYIYFFFFARNIPDISFHLRIVTKDSIMANHTSYNISPSQKNSSSMHNLPAPLQSPQRERGREEGGMGKVLLVLISRSCLFIRGNGLF